MQGSMQPSHLGSQRCIQGKTGTDSRFQKDQENGESVLGSYKSLACLAEWSGDWGELGGYCQEVH